MCLESIDLESYLKYGFNYAPRWCHLAWLHISVATAGLIYVLLRVDEDFPSSTWVPQFYKNCLKSHRLHLDIFLQFTSYSLHLGLRTWGKSIKLILLSLFPFQWLFSYIKKIRNVLHTSESYHAQGYKWHRTVNQFDILVSAKSPLIKAS